MIVFFAGYTVLISLADGPDTASTAITSEDELLTCVRKRLALHTIAYGPEADAELLARLVERSDGAALEADEASIDRVLQTVPLQ